jgi:uncharacterized protein (TIGR02452 family)
MATRGDLRDVYADTVRKCRRGGKFHSCTHTASKMYTQNDLKNVVMAEKFKEMDVIVVNQDTFLTAREYQILYPHSRVIALNMTSNYTPGGGVERGSMAQEEELFRRSNYHLTLTNKFYPLQNGNVVVSGISVIKDQHYRDLAEPFDLMMIAGTALRGPDLTYLNGKPSYTEQQREYTSILISNIFKACYLSNCDTLILGAIGCGAYGNPPREVVAIFNRYLTRFARCFRRVVFAVYSRKDPNFDIFSATITASFPPIDDNPDNNNPDNNNPNNSNSNSNKDNNNNNNNSNDNNNDINNNNKKE